MQLINELSRILDLENPISEANKKLVNTWMNINGTIQRVKEFNFDCNTIFVKNGAVSQAIKQIKSIDVFLPECGQYMLPDGSILFLTRKHIISWYKSFTQDAYNIKTSVTNVYATYELLNVIHKQKPKSILVSNDGYIYMNCLKIGYIVAANNTVVCTNKQFEQELKDWIKYDC